MTIFAGVSGSGKSTFASEFIEACRLQGLVAEQDSKQLVAEADHYFESENGSYKYDSSQLQDAHKYCENKVKTALLANCPFMCVANTFTQKWEMYSYIEMAHIFGYQLVVIEISSPLSEKELSTRNLHGVSADKIRSMRARFETVQQGIWDRDAILDFLITNNPRVISGRYYGFRIKHSMILDAAHYLTPWLRNETIADLRVAVKNLRKRNEHDGKDSEYHLTVYPPSARPLSEEEKKELLQLLYTTDVVISGAGTVASESCRAFFFTVMEECIAPIREWLQEHGFPTWSPHITWGFLGDDVHGVAKLPIEQLWEPTAGDIGLASCLLHPHVVVKAKRSCGRVHADISVVGVPGLGDDLTYSRYPELLSLVPRGLVYLQESDGSWKCVLRGITKFTGTIGNDGMTST